MSTTGDARNQEAGKPASQQASQPQHKRAVMRMPKTAVLGALLVVVCATPLAMALPALSVLYLFPIAFIVWLFRTQTVADGNGLTVRTTFGTRFLRWSDLSGLALTGKSTVRAVLTDGRQVSLPSVRVRHLPVLSLVSGGRISDPTEPRPRPAAPSRASEVS
ncbi:PH domain-containing protein [Haloechinothrix sp. LS1_15]|uniref:PH domain-containing protein n=1 Tax=Haloechinothrix sp. LS1_15 TaxID=2652248 RepID=UPI00294B77F3|nr:PH domain-containing protein [Haloechinothrix sp. LS1_15]